VGIIQAEELYMALTWNPSSSAWFYCLRKQRSTAWSWIISCVGVFTLYSSLGASVATHTHTHTQIHTQIPKTPSHEFFSLLKRKTAQILSQQSFLKSYLYGGLNMRDFELPTLFSGPPCQSCFFSTIGCNNSLLAHLCCSWISFDSYDTELCRYF